MTETLTRIDKEIQDENGVWYQMKIVPYRTAENVIEGTVVTFVDIDAQKKNAALAETIVETVREPLLILDGDLHVMTANPAFYRHFQTSPKDTLGRLIYDLGDRQWDIPELRRLLDQIVPKDTQFEGFEVTHNFPGHRTQNHTTQRPPNHAQRRGDPPHPPGLRGCHRSTAGPEPDAGIVNPRV